MILFFFLNVAVLCSLLSKFLDKLQLTDKLLDCLNTQPNFY